MSRHRFVIADTHFSQASMCAFGDEKGNPLRPWGRCVPNWKEMSLEERNDLMPEFKQRAGEMDEAMVERWNAVVPKEGATVYHLGDVAMRRQDLAILSRLNGKKKLIKGNHDLFPLKHYTPYFYDIDAYRIKDGIIMSHIPVHEESIKQRWKANVHGHLHSDYVTKKEIKAPYWFMGQKVSYAIIDEFKPHPKYLCVSVERTGFSPLPWEDMIDRINKQQE